MENFHTQKKPSLLWSGKTVGDTERNFLETLVNRFEHHKNLIWVVAEEHAEEYSPARISNIAEVIRNADDPNIDQFEIQYNVSEPMYCTKV